jgi:hypothetical protein
MILLFLAASGSSCGEHPKNAALASQARRASTTMDM